MDELNLCPLCNQIVKKQIIKFPIYFIECNICGKFNVNDFILKHGIDFKKYEKYVLSGITRQYSEKGQCITIDDENLQQIVDSVSIPDGPLEKMDLILLYISKKTTYEGSYVFINMGNDYPIAFAKNANEMIYFLQILCHELNRVEKTDVFNYRLTVEGWKRLAEISKEKRDSSQAFVAMWFDKETDDAWENGFKPALKETGYHPIRIDKEEFNEKIDDKIIANIRKSGLLIADFTENRSGVYYEAGFAMGLGITVIWTCHKDYIDKLHFDTRQYNHIVWENPQDLKEKLINRIEATLPNRVKRKFEI